ncbi:P-loop containing nucleoside triphosphate hydrolase protein [Dissoconium aciculare CBS 342.82]|uniref:P-loop containing nucleoside triphosphate hydrolase protein n=1 Tax=Dissoconium aciculare CBS 342.82 TaxID=1314786 RepID=A0A6J3LSM6_9PEZI|nr:P-loop containing nucleoside triphosphate hydrolase protein [Dissoconium aciculare CBS 342.82]KAF1818294.1 P-loop containing nucleoside triphosphate hydrolase protein [Dissoconium aciculare CBS 342.82]
MKRGLPEKRRIPNVKKVILVSSAKGGVGKSTLSINLALALARQGLHTGILDADIYGPSIPTLLNLEDHSPELTPTSTLLPLTSYGLSAISMGFLVPQHKPIAWRGLLIQKALNQLLFEVSWPSTLDVLVIDLPPGTGDVQLTIMQSVILDGAIVVSTPQTLALRDVQRGVAMMGTMGVEVLGLVQNMSGFVCGGCGMRHEIFGSDGVKKICGELDVPFLGEIPLNASICADADVGKPTMVASPESPSAEAFMAVAEKVRRAIDI